MFVYVVDIPWVFWLVVLFLLYFVVVKHFWLFLITIVPTASLGILFVRWCWGRQDKRRARRAAAVLERISSERS
jgi:Flp pilus assembly protein TadB